MAIEAERDWLEGVLSRYEQPLLRYAASLVGASIAADVVQETFLALCREPRTKVEGHVSAWLFTVCRNRALDLLRQRKRDAELMEDDMKSPESGPSSKLERDETLSRLMTVVDELPERQREVLRLKFAAGLRYKEIAEVTDLSISNVGVILHNAIKTVREKLAAQDALELRRAR
jgi:RNA polymerase sigma-70 factor (ECF subfamily)